MHWFTEMLLIAVLLCILAPCIGSMFCTGIFVTELAKNLDKIPPSGSSKHSYRPDGFDASDETQTERREFVQQMKTNGFWERTDVLGSTPSVYVTPLFLVQPVKAQNTMLEVAYAYWMCELDDFGQLVGGHSWCHIRIKIDNATPTGDTIGLYDPADGFRFD